MSFSHLQSGKCHPTNRFLPCHCEHSLMSLYPKWHCKIKGEFLFDNLCLKLICRNNFSLMILLTSHEPAFCDSPIPRQDFPWQKQQQWDFFLSLSPSFLTTAVSLELLPHPLFLSSVLLKGNKSLLVPSSLENCLKEAARVSILVFNPPIHSIDLLLHLFSILFLPCPLPCPHSLIQIWNKILPMPSPLKNCQSESMMMSYFWFYVCPIQFSVFSFPHKTLPIPMILPSLCSIAN